MKKWVVIAVVALLAVVSRGMALFPVAVLLLAPVPLDAWIAVTRDRRYRYTPWGLTRRWWRLWFVSPPRAVAPPPAQFPPYYSPGYPPALPPAPAGERRSRQAIPRAVKQAVWSRDGGRCRGCGISDADAMLRDGEHLHYDHIWPFSRNGADTVGNLQLLCGPCNRRKSDRA